ncbi:MAG TPA: DNA polymerase III subunit delta' [Bacillota bacterium]
MRLDGIRQSLVRGVLARAVATGRVAHAYLFAGEPGLGQEEAARSVIAALLCAEPDPGGACGRCPACRKIEAGNHPDVLWVAPEGATFKTDQVATVVRELRYRPVEGRLRCAVLAGADTMTMEAANRLLKTLEEPPGDALLILLAADESRLPETIRSRCQRVVFRPLAIQDLARELMDGGPSGGAGERRAHWLARLARGNPERARALAEHPQLDAIRDTVRDGLERVGQGDPLAALETAEQWSSWDAADVDLALDIGEASLVEAWLQGGAIGSARAAAAGAEMPQDRLARTWRDVEPEAVLAAFARARWRLAARVGVQNVLDALFLELQAARA